MKKENPTDPKSKGRFNATFNSSPPKNVPIKAEIPKARPKPIRAPIRIGAALLDAWGSCSVAEEG